MAYQFTDTPSPFGLESMEMRGGAQSNLGVLDPITGKRRKKKLLTYDNGMDAIKNVSSTLPTLRNPRRQNEIR